MELNRCAITSVVRPAVSRCNACWMSRSARVSSADVASSRISTGASFKKARAIVKQFAGDLQAALKGAIEAQGFESAIGVCNLEAPEIAARLSHDSGWRVGRTALRLRNPANAPTPEELAVLQDFQARANGGEPLAKMEHAAVITEEGARRFHYMKAIPVKELCTTCHGAQVEATLLQAIKARYPEDAATGFAVGELRGAFTLSKPLD